MSILQTIEKPADIKPLNAKQLSQLAQEVRDEMLKTISELGGHLASSMGAVELNLALHYVFNAPEDKLVWDMGYQAFTHKLITGRRDSFNTLKQFKGLSGFCNKDESPYDLFTTGHGGVCLSTALGMAMARDQAKEPHQVIAIIGDASLGEGMALEALNHIGHVNTNILVILNDNKMSIAKPVGGLSRYLNRIITNPTYNKVRNDFERFVRKLPAGSQLVKLGDKVQESIKGLLVPGLVFEELGFRYVGPIDGHNLPELISTLKNVRRLKGPILMHVNTLKGKGYKYAVKDPERFHKIEPFELESGELKDPSSSISYMSKNGSGRSKPKPKASETFSEAFSDEIIRIGEINKRVIAITAAMPEGTGVAEFGRRFPERLIDVGMAEQHAVGLAAGLARGGAMPIVAIYSTFLQRAFDQIMHEMCLQALPVILSIDRASLVGEDGPTHHGVFDIAYIRPLPNIRIVSPKDPTELRAMLRWAVDQDKPVAIRYSRGGIMCGEPVAKSSRIVTGKSETLRQGSHIALLAVGSMVYPALKVAEDLSREGIEALVINARFIKPIDELMVRAAVATGAVVTLEESQIAGGFGSAVSETMDALGLPAVPHLRIGLPDGFVEHGKRSELLRLTHLDPESLTQRVLRWHHGLKAPSEEIRLLAQSE